MADASDPPAPAPAEAPPAGAAGPGRVHVVRADGSAGDASTRVQPYDFRNPNFLPETEMRQLRLVHEDFVRYLASRVSLYLRMEFALKISGFTTQTYGEFTERLPNPSHLNLFKVEPLVGVGVLDMNPRLALTAADRLLGGKGQAVKADRDLTEIEISLVEDLVVIVLDEWAGLWKSERPLQPKVIGHETNGRFLQTAPREATMLVLTLEATLGDCTEAIQIGVPYYTLESLLKQMRERRQKESEVVTLSRKPAWHPAYEQIRLPVRAEWNAFEISVREIASLRVGDVVEMAPSILGETQVLINGTAKFIGTVGLDADHVVVQLTQQLTPEKSLHA